ncbi:DUF58 domain-containing protein [Oceanithermus sp.]|nr:DUF58 domain-containing protein [Oceanithermus sp.]
MSLALLLLTLAALALWVALPGLAPGRQRVRTARPYGAAGRERPLELEAEFVLPLPAFWRVEWTPATRLGFRGEQAAGLGWGRVRLRLEAAVEPRRRGEYELPGARLFVRDFLGFYEREVRLEGPRGRLLVYPRIWEQLPPQLALTLLAEGPEAPELGLEDASRYRGTREYRPGDALRRMHWKATARQGHPMVREFAWVRATGVWIYIDVRGGEVYIDHMAELAASLAVRLMDLGLAVGLAWPGFERPPARGLEALRGMLAALARLEPAEAGGAPPLPPPGVNLVVFTQDAPLELIEGALAARARAARVHLLAFPEGFFLRPGEKGRPIWGRTDGMARLQERRGLLHAAGVYVHVFRGDEAVRFSRA